MLAEVVIKNVGFVATAELQFEERFVPFPNTPDTGRSMRILQQRWVKAGTMWGTTLDETNSEWRDVPCVKEGT